MEEQKISQSPIINKAEIEPVEDITETMSFPEIIKYIIEGKKAHKLEWKDKEFYVFLNVLNDGYLSLHKPDGNNYHWIINDGDLMGDDYIIL